MTDQAAQPQEGTPTVASDQEEHRQVPAWRLLGTLGTVGALAGLLIVIVFRATQPTIQAYKAQMLRLAVQEGLKAPEHYDTLYVYDGALTAEVPKGVDTRKLEEVYRGYRADGQPVGYAIVASGPGFRDIVKLIFGYDPASDKLLGMKVLEAKETPGLGDKIDKDTRFISQFDGAKPPLVGIKGGAGDTADPSQVEMITGATISSRTVIRLINEELQHLQPLLKAAGNGARP